MQERVTTSKGLQLRNAVQIEFVNCIFNGYTQLDKPNGGKTNFKFQLFNYNFEGCQELKPS